MADVASALVTVRSYLRANAKQKAGHRTLAEMDVRWGQALGSAGEVLDGTKQPLTSPLRGKARGT